MSLENSVLPGMVKGKITQWLVLLAPLLLLLVWLFTMDRHVYNYAVTAPGTVANDWFGSAIAVNDHWAVIAAFRESAIAKQAGAVYFYQRDDLTGWQYKQIIRASDAQPLDQFGFSVAMQGDSLVVGSVSTFAIEPLERSDGRVYVFQLSDAGWVEQAILVAPDARQGDRFGYSVALSGEWLIVGAKYAGSDQNSTGAAYLYQYQDNHWIYRQTFKPESLQNGDEFGTAVDINSAQGLLAVGAPGMDFAGKKDSGAIYLYQLQGSEWELAGQLDVLEQPPEFHQLGVGLALSKNEKRLLAGASSWKREPRTGAAYVIELANEGDLSSPRSVTPLAPISLNTGDMFGFRVAWAGDTAIVSAHLADGEQEDTGAVLAFSYDNGQWMPEFELIAVDQHKQDNYGIALDGHDIDGLGKQIIVGAETADVKGKDSGGIYFHILKTP